MGAAGSVSNGVDAADIRNETDPTLPCKLLQAAMRRCLGTLAQRDYYVKECASEPWRVLREQYGKQSHSSFGLVQSTMRN